MPQGLPESRSHPDLTKRIYRQQSITFAITGEYYGQRPLLCVARERKAMRMPESIDSFLFAPCGMNCMVCSIHLKNKNPCSGCRGDNVDKPDRCKKCKIKNCAISNGLDYCYECIQFPCKNIKDLENSYKTRYKISLVANSECVKKNGLKLFMKHEGEEWLCGCGGVISLHDRYCSECKKNMKMKYWK